MQHQILLSLKSQSDYWLVTALCAAIRLPANFSADDFERYRWVKTEAINHPAFSVTNAPLLSFSRVEISVKSKKPQKRQVFKIRQEMKDFCQSFFLWNWEFVYFLAYWPIRIAQTVFWLVSVNIAGKNNNITSFLTKFEENWFQMQLVKHVTGELILGKTWIENLKTASPRAFTCSVDTFTLSEKPFKPKIEHL